MNPIIVLCLALAALGYMIYMEWKGDRNMDDVFEPREVPNMEYVEPGKYLRCTHTQWAFTEGYHYKVRLAKGGVPVVWNDEMKPVLLAGLNPEWFVVEEDEEVQ